MSDEDKTIPAEDIEDILVVEEKAPAAPEAPKTDDEVEADFNAAVEQASAPNIEFLNKTVSEMKDSIDKFNEDLNAGKIDATYQKRHENA